jgi:DinB superfamily
MTALTPEERHVLVESLQGGGQALVEAVLDLTPAQWTFRPGPGSWSIGECCEHVELTERHILQRIATAGPEGLDQTAGKDQFVPRAVTSRHRRVQAPEAMIPQGKYVGPAAFIESFRVTRSRALALAQDESANLRGVCAPHFALKELDGYQWLLMTSSHTLRHLEQVKEILAHADFPTA